MEKIDELFSFIPEHVQGGTRSLLIVLISIQFLAFVIWIVMVFREMLDSRRKRLEEIKEE